MKKKSSKTPKQDPLWVNQQTIALIFGVSASTILKWTDLPSEKRGRERQYHVPACVKWLMDKERAKLSSLQHEQAKYTKARRERQELILEQERGNLIRVDDAVGFVTELGLQLKGQLEGLPSRLCGRLAGMTETRPIAALLKQEFRAVLTSFREKKLP